MGDTQQLQGLSMRLDGRGESSERSGRYTTSSLRWEGWNCLRGVYTAATRFISET